MAVPGMLGRQEANDHPCYRDDQDEESKGRCGVHGDLPAGREPYDKPVSRRRPEQCGWSVCAMVLHEEGQWGS